MGAIMAENTTQQHSLPKIDPTTMRVVEGHSTMVNGKIRDVIVMENDTHIALIMFSAKEKPVDIQRTPDNNTSEDTHGK